MKNILKFVFVASLFLFFGGYYISNAEVNSDIISPILSSVGIHNIQVLSQDGNNINLSFEISNKEKIQSGVKYSVKVVKETDKGQFVVDEKVYDETLTLAENSIIKKEITYVAPASLNGEYTILVVSRSESGYVFSVSYGGKIEIERAQDGVFIMNETCNLSVDSDKFKRSYALTEGVDISQEENLILSCMLLNSLSNEVSLSPLFETHFRTVYGDIVPHVDVINESTTLAPGEEKSVSITLPKAKNPQAYDVKVKFSYNGGESNPVIAHYVIQGVSATIQNASLDKDFYKKGETANVFFSWFPSADNFPNSRLGKATEVSEVFVKGKITNNMGLKCVDDIYEPLSQDHNTMKNNLSLPVKRDCVDPNLTFSLLDKDGNVLDERTFSVVTASEDAPTNTKMIMMIIAIILVVIILVIFFIRNKKSGIGMNTNTIASIAILAIFLFGLGFGALKINADIEMVINGGTGGAETGPGDLGVTPPGLNASINLTQAVYDVNTSVGVTTSVYYVACTNATRNIVATGYISGNDYTSATKTLFNSSVSGSESQVYSSTTLNAPPTAGDYVLNVKIDGYTLPYYRMMDDGTYVVESNYFNDFVEKINQYISTNYASHPNINNIQAVLNDADILMDLQIINTYINTIALSEDKSTLDFTRNYQIPVEVVGVEALINEKDTSDDVDYDGSASIKWRAINPVYGCRCLFTPASGDPSTTFCGQNDPSHDDVVFGPYNVNNLKIDTEFTVECPTYKKW